MRDFLIMSAKERKRKVILEGVLDGQYTLKEAAIRMEMSYRQAKRVKKRYLAEHDVGLLHRSRGRSSGRAKDKNFRLNVLQTYQSKYMPHDFGPTLASEFLLEEDNITIHPETLRLWLKAEGLWVRKRKRRAHRNRRTPREQFGELLQIDGSDHHWFGREHPRCCLLNMVDDATGTTMAMLDTGETTWVLLTVLKKWIKRYGIPQAVYVDRKNVYVMPEEDGWSVFQEVCRKLDISIIEANSPQAKGRVERKHALFQDRFLKELAFRGITEISEANKLLEGSVLKKYNKKFIREAANQQDGHRCARPLGDLDQLICWETTRQLKNDYTFQLQNEYYQVLKESKDHADPGSKILIRGHLSGKKSVWRNSKRLKCKKLDVKPAVTQKSVAKKKRALGPSRSELARKNKHKSPWSRGGTLMRLSI